MAPARALHYTGPQNFRHRIALSLLSLKPLTIKSIRSDDLDPGLKEHETSFLNLIDQMTNGTKIDINDSGTQVRLIPGVIMGGEIEFECDNGKGIGYFLEGILPLAPFGKDPLKLVLKGVTDGYENVEPSVDLINNSMLPLYQLFGVGVDDDISPPALRVMKRGAKPLGEGEVEFFCPVVRSLKPINYVDPGMIKKVRGSAISCRISPTSVARVSYSAKGVLHQLLPDVWIATDAHSSGGNKVGEKRKKGGCGPSPGLSCVLTTESTTGVHLSSEICLDASERRGQTLPEDIGTRAATLLLEEVQRGGCVDSASQTFILTLMALSPEDISRVRIGTLSKYTMRSLRSLKDAFDIEFKLKADAETKTIVMSCLGVGFRNSAKKVT